jgi:hypothetical protein
MKDAMNKGTNQLNCSYQKMWLVATKKIVASINARRVHHTYFGARMSFCTIKKLKRGVSAPDETNNNITKVDRKGKTAPHKTSGRQGQTKEADSPWGKNRFPTFCHIQIL